MFQTKFLTLLLLSFAVVSCGFTPLYKRPEGKKSACNNFTVQINDIDSANQRLKYKLQDILNVSCILPDKKFNVVTTVNRSKQGLGVQKDREVTRFNVILDSSYNVFDSDNKNIYSSRSRISGAFDAQISDYGTFALEQDTVNKLVEELAREISLKIASKLAKKQ
ncbi:MAG TPA: hypothetical protein DIV86_02345 [Alphaproteobacteria bacterium]|nr:hypothetical protein [Alphaproteobacteria bacterium]